VGLHVAQSRSFQESAKKSQLRAEFHAAIDDARRNKIRHLVFYVWDRITRNFTDAEILEELVRDGEITLHIASGGSVLHANSDDSEFFLFDINVAQAKQDNRNRRRKTLDAMIQRCTRAACLSTTGTSRCSTRTGNRASAGAPSKDRRPKDARSSAGKWISI
jgi:DNA invertase Pin-like site-specific DNA recombinase